jgi:cell division protein FtsW
VRLIKNIQGDKAIWGVVALLALFSFLPVYSASTNLVYIEGRGTTLGYLVKHAALLVMGFGIIYGVHKVPTRYFKGLSYMLLPIVILLLVYTLALGKKVAGVEASRWIEIPFIGMSFQTSNLAAVVLMIWVARYLAKIKDRTIKFSESLLPLWLPVAIVIGLILPANLSTAAILGFMVIMLCFLGGYPIKYLLAMMGSGVIVLILMFMLVKMSPETFENSRVATWESRIESFFNPDAVDKDRTMQSEYAKIAIAKGGLLGNGAGKSVMKNMLPQSASDFIFAIIVEEYGMLGGLALLFFYMLLLFRIVVVANGAPSVFSKLVVIGVGLPIVFQALVNMAVAVQLFPVTGQPLPLISMGGTSIWMTCLAIGVVLSASKKEKVDEESELPFDGTNPLEVLSGQL